MASNSGDKCPGGACNGRLRTRTSKQCGDRQVRYLECPTCGKQARSVVEASHVWRRCIVQR